MFYYISLGAYFVSLIGMTNNGLAGCFNCLLSCYALGVFIWNATCYNVVFVDIVYLRNNFDLTTEK